MAVSDISPSRRILAESDGFAVLSRTHLVRSSVAVIGCSGARSFEPSDFEGLSQKLVVGSGSSRQVEVEGIMGNFGPSFVIPVGIGGSAILSSSRYPNVLLLNEGYPINFVGESLPFAIIDLVFAQLVVAFSRIGSQDLPAMLHDLTKEELERVATAWLAEHPNYPDVVDSRPRESGLVNEGWPASRAGPQADAGRPPGAP